MYNQFIFLPLYNGLVGIMNLLPGIDVGVAVIIFTCVVRLILFPLSKKALITQVRMKNVEPEANRIRAQYANNKQEQALKIMELYREKKIKPFTSVLLLIIQLQKRFGLQKWVMIIWEMILEILYESMMIIRTDLIKNNITMQLKLVTWLRLKD
jgi:YidC/Oxa1 family membrane protein insertase